MKTEPASSCRSAPTPGPACHDKEGVPHYGERESAIGITIKAFLSLSFFGTRQIQTGEKERKGGEDDWNEGALCKGSEV